MNPASQVLVPIFRLDDSGAVMPNPMFHRPVDRLHSRCIEYPFAASCLHGRAQRILDVGSAKSDDTWLRYLSTLDVEVHLTDYDPRPEWCPQLPYHQCDLRQLPLEDNSFDLVFAVSVIEHIGLESSQVSSQHQPMVDSLGDVHAVRELARVLRPGGELVMTFPMGIKDGLMASGTARRYTAETIQRFSDVIPAEVLEYYEYQLKDRWTCAVESIDRRTLRQRLVQRFRRPEPAHPPAPRVPVPQLPGSVTWRRTSLAHAAAQNELHVDGLACGIWRKPGHDAIDTIQV